MSKKARVAVITLQAVKNYGSVLQAYATQVVLERLDQDVVIIDYIREFNLDNKIADKITENDKGLKKIAKEIVLYPTIKKWKKVFNDFLKKNLNLTKKVYTYPQDFIENPIEADVFCVGSDQVWNIEWNDGIIGPLYLDFVKDKKKISFSSSIGMSALGEKSKEVAKLLMDFSNITVRERSGVEMLHAIGVEKVSYCCDPTLLLDCSFWKEFSKAPKKCPKKYVLLYQLNRNHEFDKMASEIASKLNCELVRICMRYDQIRLPGKHIIVPEVSEFLGLIENAELILTDSFHATAFSINFNKNFYVVYVELLLNSVDRCVAIRPCEKGNPNAIHWGRLKEGRWCASTLGCRGLAKTLFDIMEWEEGLKYRFRGQFVEQGDNKLMLFELDEPEMIKIEEIVLPSKEEEAEGKTVKQMIYIFPPEWEGTFGQPITSIAQVGILQQEHYAGNWDVLRPAAEIKEMNTFTADGLNKLLHEAEEIMEGWTDTNE